MKKYCHPQSQEYLSKRFLDCCGLVRQVVRELSPHFGFQLAPMWNQGYMFDTLPQVRSLESMEPGDLIFYSGVFENPEVHTPAPPASFEFTHPARTRCHTRRMTWCT